MARRGERDRSKERFWQQVVQDWQRSGQSVRAYCTGRGLREPSFYAWRRTLAERGQPRFVPVHVTPAAPPAPLEVVVDGRQVVRVPAGFDPATLRQLLAVLAEAVPC